MKIFERTGWSDNQRYREEWAVREAETLEDASPEEIVRWAAAEFGDRLGLAASFQLESSMLIHLLSQASDQPRVFYLDTEALFPETYAARDRLIERYGMQPIRFRPALTLDDQAAIYGDRLWERDPDQCCDLRKVQPLKLALSGLDAWMTGIRRDQAVTRANARVVEWDNRGLIKVNPLVRLSREDVRAYVDEHDIPYNELHDQGYASVGCTYCTRPVAEGEDPRAGRWSGTSKIECGLHSSSPGRVPPHD